MMMMDSAYTEGGGEGAQRLELSRLKRKIAFGLEAV